MHSPGTVVTPLGPMHSPGTVVTSWAPGASDPGPAGPDPPDPGQGAPDPDLRFRGPQPGG
jgi:hypothetical protein